MTFQECYSQPQISKKEFLETTLPIIDVEYDAPVSELISKLGDLYNNYNQECKSSNMITILEDLQIQYEI